MGKYRIDEVDTGSFKLDGGAMFGVVPKVLWQRSNPPDDGNRISMALRAMLVRGEGRVLLVDTGIGELWGPKQREMYAIDHSKATLLGSLEALGVAAGEVTDVVISHLHFDHVGGSTLAGGKLMFPNATYFIHEANLAHAHAPTEKDRASFLAQTLDPLFRSGRLETVKDGHTFAPGIDAWVTHGHTPGQLLVKVSDGGKTVLFCADTIPTSSHVPVPWVMAYDNHPLTTIEEKKVILSRAVAEDWTLFFVHDPAIATCRVAHRDGKYSPILEGARHLPG